MHVFTRALNNFLAYFTLLNPEEYHYLCHQVKRNWCRNINLGLCLVGIELLLPLEIEFIFDFSNVEISVIVRYGRSESVN